MNRFARWLGALCGWLTARQLQAAVKAAGPAGRELIIEFLWGSEDIT